MDFKTWFPTFTDHETTHDHASVSILEGPQSKFVLTHLLKGNRLSSESPK